MQRTLKQDVESKVECEYGFLAIRTGLRTASFLSCCLLPPLHVLFINVLSVKQHREREKREKGTHGRSHRIQLFLLFIVQLSVYCSSTFVDPV